MKNIDELKSDLAQLQREFDASFTEVLTDKAAAGTKMILAALAGEFYAIPMEHARAIIKPPHITKVPCASQVIMGIINLNGEIVPVSDIRVLLDVPVLPADAHSRLVITKNLPFAGSLWVDKIYGIVPIHPEEVQPALNTLSAAKTEFIQGICYHANKLVVILNMVNLFRSKAMLA